MSFEGVDARCMITRLDVKNMIKVLNQRLKNKQRSIATEFTIPEESSRCLREYIDLLLMDVANKYVKMIRYTNENRNGNDKVKEELIIDTILKQSKHLITDTNESKYALNQCFLVETNKNTNDKIPLNSIFLKDEFEYV